MTEPPPAAGEPAQTAARTSGTGRPVGQPDVDLGTERLVVAGMALATPRGFSGYPCDEPCVLVLRANSVAGGVLPFAKLEVMLGVPGSLAELQANGARTYSANGTIPVTQTTTQMGRDPAFDLEYDVSGTPFRQIARHVKRGNAFYVLTISGPREVPDAPIWAMLRAIMNDARVVGPEPTPAVLQALYRTPAQRQRDAERTEQIRVGAPSGMQRPDRAAPAGGANGARPNVPAPPSRRGSGAPARSPTTP